MKEEGRRKSYAAAKTEALYHKSANKTKREKERRRAKG